MRIVIDTEFNGFQGSLISMALVAENGREFYEVLELNEPVDPWVAEHVMPILNKPAIDREQFSAQLANFLAPFGRIHVFADWPEDIAHFCGALITGPGRCLQLKDPRPQFTINFTLPNTATTSATPHNALEDARALAKAVFGWKT